MIRQDLDRQTLPSSPAGDPGFTESCPCRSRAVFMRTRVSLSPSHPRILSLCVCLNQCLFLFLRTAAALGDEGVVTGLLGTQACSDPGTGSHPHQ